MTENKPITYYVERYIQGSISGAEWTKLRQLLNLRENEEIVKELMDNQLRLLSQSSDNFPGHTNKIVEAVAASVSQEVAQAAAPVHKVHFLQTAWFRYAAAILILFGVGTWLWRANQHEKPLVQNNTPVNVKNEVLPGGSKATLTLSDGRTITLDSAANGHLAQQPGASIEKTADGLVIYSFNKGLYSGTVSYNTISTPRGGQYQVILPDGSKVWLNAESSIIFPTAFMGHYREVKITGEAYFEVVSNKQKPFIVKTWSDPEERAVKTSLVEGAVKIAQAVLHPNQAYINGKVMPTNIAQDIAWKNGEFNFQDKKFDEVMRQLSRWYDIEVIYPDGIPENEYGGELKRNLTLSQVLKILENSDVTFHLDGRKLTVKP
jgi:transmembrane sensor